MTSTPAQPWGLHEFTARYPDGNRLRVFYDVATPERERAGSSRLHADVPTDPGPPAMRVRPCAADDRQACLDILGENTPEFFIPGDRDGLAAFLSDLPSPCFVGERDGRIIACGGWVHGLFAKERFRVVGVVPDGFGPGLDRVTMERTLFRDQL